MDYNLNDKSIFLNKTFEELKHNVAKSMSEEFMALPIIFENSTDEATDRLHFILKKNNWKKQIYRPLFEQISKEGDASILMEIGEFPHISLARSTIAAKEDGFGNLLSINALRTTLKLNNSDIGFVSYNVSLGKILTITQGKTQFGISRYPLTVERFNELSGLNLQEEIDFGEAFVPAVYFVNPIGTYGGQSDLQAYLEYSIPSRGNTAFQMELHKRNNIYTHVEGQEDMPNSMLETEDLANKAQVSKSRGWFIKVKSLITPAGTDSKLEDSFATITDPLQLEGYKKEFKETENDILKWLGIGKGEKESGTNMMNFEARMTLIGDKAPIELKKQIFEEKFTELFTKIIELDIILGNSSFYKGIDIDKFEFKFGINQMNEIEQPTNEIQPIEGENNGDENE